MKHLFLLILLFCSTCVKSQFVAIPDTNFVTWLQTNGYSQCMLGNLMDTTCPAVVNDTAIACYNSGITNLEGVQYFDNLLRLICSYNPVTTIPALPNNLTYFECTSNSLVSLPALPNSLTDLLCSYNNLTSLPALPGGLVNLDCWNNQLSNLPVLPNTLVYLNCGSNNLSSIPILPNGLKSLGCGDNPLGTLPALPNGLTDLGCASNHLSSLPPLPDSLRTFGCGDNQLTSIPALPAGLTIFGCEYNYNYLTSLPALPRGITNLYCNDNQLHSLPDLPDSLRSLWCHNNQLDSFPAFPDRLIFLRCYNNRLSVLPTLPNGLTDCECHDNPFTSLPALPGSLRNLSCRNSLFTVLPVLPNGIRQVSCGHGRLNSLPSLPNSLVNLNFEHNQINSLPELPDSLDFLWIDNNPITCFPRLKRIVNLRFDSTFVTCLPNYGNVTTSVPALNTYPLCDALNPSGCEAFWNITGNVYIDVNNNCLEDAIDTAQRNIKVQLWSGGNLLQQKFTEGEGFYSFDVDNFGNYEIRVDTSGIPLFVSCPLNNLLHDTITAIDSFDTNQSFALECLPGIDLAAWSIEGRFRPAGINGVDIHAGFSSSFYEFNCTSAISGSVTIEITGPASYFSPAPGALTPDNVSGNLLTYNVPDFSNIDFNRSFGIMVHTDTTAPLGSIICISVTVNPISGDYVPDNNAQTRCFAVRNSFDPNDKYVYPAAGIDTSQKWLFYTIHFQNTGTDTAQHIYLTDTLDSDLDYPTFQLLAYSRQPLVQIKGNAVRFNFPNINLPDSNTNEPLSHGYVQYKIKLKDNLPIGTTINNTAFIYFDFNAPVVTNTTKNTITTTTEVPNTQLKTPSFKLFPNPAMSSLNVTGDESIIGSTLSIYDMTGKKLSVVYLTAQHSIINTEHFSEGVYIAEIKTKWTSVKCRWIKM